MFLSNLWAKHQANGAASGVRDSLSSMSMTAGDKEKVQRESARAEAAEALKEKQAARAERKAKLSEAWAKNRDGK